MSVHEQKSIESFFVEYPYRHYQDRWAYVNRKILGKFHSENFLKEKHQFYLTQREWEAAYPHLKTPAKNSADDPSTDDDSSNVVGLSSFKKFSLLSELLQKEAYLLKDFLVSDSGASHSLSNEERLYVQLWHKMLGSMEQQGSAPDFVAARIPTENVAAINALLENGFYYVANEAIYMMRLETAGKIPEVLLEDLARADEMYLAEPSFSFRLAHAGDTPALMKLVEKTPFPSRYHHDKHFTPELVCQIYQETLRQSLQLENHHVGLCEIKTGSKKKLVGFISFIFNKVLSEKLDRGWASLDYIAVDREYRKSGLATLLNAWAIQFLACSGSSIMQVKTLAENYPSSALLMRSQFKVTANNVLLHRMI